MRKSAVSRRFVAATEAALLHGLDLVAMSVDGVHFGEHLCVVALGIGVDDVRRPLGLERDPGAALVRRRDDRSRQAVPASTATCPRSAPRSTSTSPRKARDDLVTPPPVRR